MWSYGPPFPTFKSVELKSPEWIDFDVYSHVFEGFCMDTGTYIHGKPHVVGIKNSYQMSDISLDRLFDVDAYVLRFSIDNLAKEGNRPFITEKDIKKAEKEEIPDGSNIIVATGWGQHWDKPDFLTHNWFFKKDAIEYLVSKKPFILAGDTPHYDNVDNEQGTWELIYGNDILIVAPLVNIEKITTFKVKLYVCPLKILNTEGLPCRVIIKEE
jgi:kynurenine formamidase